MSAYVDTSALAKWYVREPGSDRFESWIRADPRPVISCLTLIEMRCLLGRRRRRGLLDKETELETFGVFREHVESRFLKVEPVNDGIVRAAVHVMERVSTRHALRTLDALHLSICTACQIDQLATADAVMAAAAAELGMNVVRFD